MSKLTNSINWEETDVLLGDVKEIINDRSKSHDRLYEKYNIFTSSKPSILNNQVLFAINERLLNVEGGIPLDDFFTIDLDKIDTLYKIAYTSEEPNEKMRRCLVALLFGSKICDDEQKYLRSNCFQVNFAYTPTTDVARSLFTFSVKNSLERFNELITKTIPSLKFSSFLGTYSQSLSNFKDTECDLNMSLINTMLLYVGQIYTNSIGDISNFVNQITSIDVDKRWIKVSRIIYCLKKYEKHFNCTDSMDQFRTFLRQSMETSEKSIINDLFTINIVLLEFFLSRSQVVTYSNTRNIITFVKIISEITEQLQTIETNVEKLILSNIFSLFDKYELKKVIDVSITIFNKSGLKGFTSNQNNNSSRVKISNLYRVALDKIISSFETVNELYTIKSLRFDIFNDIISHVINQFGMVTHGEIVDYVRVFNLANAPIIREMLSYALEFYSDPKIHIFTQLARMLLFRPLFRIGMNSFAKVPFGDSLLAYINDHGYNNSLVKSLQKQVYTSVTDVHSDNRDERFYAGLEQLFTLWEPTPEQIETNYNEFWEKSKELTDNRLAKFVTIMGYTHDMKRIVYPSKGEDGDHNFTPLLHSTKVTKYGRDPKEIIARLWEFAKGYPSERLHDALIDAVCVSYQNHIICDNGKIQNMCVYVLGGRMIMKDGSVFTIEDEALFERVAARNREIAQQNDEQNPAAIYHIIKPYIDSFSNDFERPVNADDFFKKLFLYIIRNDIQINLSKIIETLCLFVETKNGFINNPDLSIANNFDDMFDLSEYKTLEYQIEFNREDVDPDLDLAIRLQNDVIDFDTDDDDDLFEPAPRQARRETVFGGLPNDTEDDEIQDLNDLDEPTPRQARRETIFGRLPNDTEDDEIQDLDDLFEPTPRQARRETIFGRLPNNTGDDVFNTRIGREHTGEQRIGEMERDAIFQNQRQTIVFRGRQANQDNGLPPVAIRPENLIVNHIIFDIRGTQLNRHIRMIRANMMDNRRDMPLRIVDVPLFNINADQDTQHHIPQVTENEITPTPQVGETNETIVRVHTHEIQPFNPYFDGETNIEPRRFPMHVIRRTDREREFTLDDVARNYVVDNTIPNTREEYGTRFNNNTIEFIHDRHQERQIIGQAVRISNHQETNQIFDDEDFCIAALFDEEIANQRQELIVRIIPLPTDVTRMISEEYQVRIVQNVQRMIFILAHSVYGLMGVNHDYLLEQPVQRNMVVVNRQDIRNTWYTMLLNHMLSCQAISQQALENTVRNTPNVNHAIQEFVEDESVNEGNYQNRRE